ncbi:hypothetical protein SLITO_v1c10760 [Spiroplasma litorale]|uniref:Uncharacterized protein n=1 Tax=Spiroplasma litorale TaxID=216942 RepID=A0A0K1W3J9_9MOLU|nr:hypothetical protein [Spiroplasma litorale]AKX34687.1 hypothetical protein SLITO_v1c10760 [Spiroplasma litorale]
MSVVFKFSIMRTLKRKLFYIPISIVIALNLFISIIIFTTSNSFMIITIGSIFIILIDMIFISFFNITNLSDFFIQDHISNIESLMIRKGRKPTVIFFSKIFANKLITTSFILVVYTLYILISLSTKIYQKETIVLKYSLGVFVLIPFDLLITWITLLIAVTTKSYKKTLPVTWVISVLFFMYPIIGPGLFVALGSSDLYDSNIISSLYRYENYKERKNKNAFLNKLYTDLNETKKLETKYKNLVDENITIKFSNESENESGDYQIIRSVTLNFITYMLSKSWLKPQLYLFSQEKNQKLVETFVKEYINNSKNNYNFKINFTSEFNQQLINLFEKDEFLKDIVTLSPSVVSATDNVKSYWNNSYFNSNDKEVLIGDNGIKGTVNSTLFSKLIKTTDDQLKNIYKIISNAYNYNFADIKYSTPNLSNVESEKYIYDKLKFEFNWSFLQKNIIIPYNFLSMVEILKDTLEDPLVPQTAYIINIDSNYTKNKSFYNLSPFNNFYVMANSFGSGDYYDAFVQKNSFLRGPAYSLVYQTNSLQQFEDPSIAPEYSSKDSYFNLGAVYSSYIIISLGLIGMCYWIYVSRIYKKSGDK